MPGAGPQLAFTRTFDAQAAQAQITASEPVPSLGYGWADNFGANVAYNATTQVATVTEGNGAQTTFSPYVSGTSPAWCTGVTNFCASAPRFEATLNQNSGGTWTYVNENGSPKSYSFASTGVLISYADASGNTITSSAYSPTSGQTVCPTSNTCAAWTSSASGRELVIATNSSGELTSVFDANSSLTAAFTYVGSSCSTFSANPALCTASDPGGIVSNYTYDSSNANANLEYDMLTLTPSGAMSQTVNQYNASGQISQQTDPNGSITTFAYGGNNSSLDGGTTTITDYPNGLSGAQDVTVDSYSSNVLISETTGYGTSAASTETFGRDPASLMPTTVTDGNGNVTTYTYQTYSGGGGTEISSGNVLTKTDGAGNTLAYAYNANNQIWCSVDAADYANGARCPSTAPTSPPAPGIADPNLGVTIAFYNSSDQVTATTDALGNTSAFTYTSGVSGVPNGLLYCSIDPVQYQKSVACPAYGAAHVTGTLTRSYDASGDLTSTTNALGNTSAYAYAYGTTQPGLVSSGVNADGTTTTYHYNGAGETTSTVVTFNGYSATTLDAYDTYGRLYCEVTPFEQAKSVTCPSSAPSTPPTPSSDPYLGATIITYDATGRVVQVTNPLGGITYSAYDQAGELFCRVLPFEAALSVTCPSNAPTSPPTIGSDPYVGATITSYDASGRVAQVTSPLGAITLYAYDGAGNVSSSTVESNNSTSAPNVVTTYTYTPDNRVASLATSSGTALYFYDPNGHRYCTVSPNAQAAGSSTYQCPTWQASWITSVPSPSALYSTSPTSAQANNVTTVFDNANGNSVQTTDPDVHTSIAVVDANGRAYCTSDAVNVASYLTAHPSGAYPYLCPSTAPTTPPSTGSNPGYVTTIYDVSGNPLTSTNQLGDTTTYTYDPIGNVLTVVDPRGKTTTNCYYDENGTGACAHGAPSGAGTAGSLYSSTTPVTTAAPSGATTTYTYFPGGAPDVVTTPAVTTTYNYDAYGDLTSSTYSGVSSGYSTPTNLSYTYNVDGSQHTMTDATGTTTYGYDANGDVASQALIANSPLSNQTVGYTYFTTGALASEIYPSYTGHTNPTVTYAYNGAGQMTSSSDWLTNVVNYTYDHDGNLTSQANPNSTTTNTFDAADLQTSASSSINQTCGGSENLLQSFAASGTPSGSRNADGQLTQYGISYSASCSGQTSQQRNYAYDLAGQVVYQGTTAQGASPNTFAYDASGDPTTISSHDTSANFDTYTQTFDNAGEVTGQSPVSGSHGASATYSYSTLGALKQSVSTTTTTYGYNAAGQMTSVTSPSGTTTYLYNGAGLEGSSQTAGVPAWNASTDVNSTRALNVVTCTSATFCVAVGASGYATIFNGTSWSTPSDVDSTRTMDALYCVSSSFCVAVDTSGYATIYNGSTWSTPTDIDGSRSVNAVTCTSTTFCVAVGSSGYAAKYTGTWAASSNIDATRTLDAVACTSTTFCEAVDTSGYAAKYTGSWATAANINSSRSLNSISCVTSTFCVAAGATGYAVKYTGSWGTPVDADSTRTVKVVTCPSTTLCVAVDASGYATTYNGSSWATPNHVDGTNALSALSCASTTFCDTVDTVGNVVTFTGSSWSSVTNIDSARSVTSVACTSSSFCAAVDSSGYAAQYQLPATTSSQLTWDSSAGMPLVLSDGTFDYVYGPGTTPVEQINLSTSTPTFMTYTADSSTWVMTNAAGDLTGFYGYDAFGTLSFGTPASGFGFAGQYSDAASGFSNMRARFYQGQTGTFTSRDPAFTSTDTAFTYAGNDPVNSFDPLGLCNTPGVIGYYPGKCATTAAESLKAGEYIQSHSGGGWSWSNAAKAEVDFGAGIANAAVSTVTFGAVHIAAPYCGFGWASDVGGIYFNLSLAILGIGEADVAATGIDEAVIGSENVGAGAEDAANAEQYVYRVHGGDSPPMGRSWTPENPMNMSDPRSELGLPKGNSGEMLSRARVTDMEGVTQRGAQPLDGNPGGATEWVFPDPTSQLEVQWTIPLVPPW